MRKNLFFILPLILSTSAFGHTYITNSRAKLCAQGENQNCGSVVYEPQSVEGPDRFPSTGPADGTIAAAGLQRFAKLNEQSPTRWNKVDIQPGQNTFTWHFTATHRSKDFRYFITKQNWNQSLPLTRDSFDLRPFCSISDNGQHPAVDTSHTCNVPNRSGYQIILGIWDVADTSSSFYSLIDARMPNGAVSPEIPPLVEQKDIGDINPSSDLNVDDTVQVRLFDFGGELQDQAIEMTIANESQGKKNTWPKLLAEYINAQSNELKAGIKDTQGNIVPVFGKNDVFANASSTIIRVEVDIDSLEVPISLSVNLERYKFITGEPMQLVIDAIAESEINITAELFYQGAKIGYKEISVSSNSQFQLDVEAPQVGTYQLIVKGETTDHKQIVQKNFTVMVIDPVTPAESIYPDKIESYIIGTLIRGQDGNTYKCLIANWCNGNRIYYAPGLGFAWDSAWQLVTKGTPLVGKKDFTYPNGLGKYQQGTIVKGANNKLYRCNIPGWCNSQSSFYYAPGTGLAWGSAWTSL